MRGVLWYDSLRYGGPDEDYLTAMAELGRRAPARPERLGLVGAAPGQAALLVEALGLPRHTFSLSCSGAIAAVRALGSGLFLEADTGVAAALLVGDGGDPILAEQSGVAAYPGLELGVPDYLEAAYLDLVRSAAEGLRADWLALNPPSPRLGKKAARELGCVLGATSELPLHALSQTMDLAAPGQRVLLVSYMAGSAAAAILLQKRGS